MRARGRPCKYDLPKEVIIDDDVKEFLCGYLNTYGWHIDGTGYCRRKNNKKAVLIHRLVAALYFGIDAIKDKEIDHINGNKLDNRISNLRICTRTENMRNKGKQNNNTSGFKGVVYLKRDKKWRAQIKVNNKLKYLGQFENKIDAALEYDKAAKLYFKEFAHLNFK
jgi:hypothetical protein